MQYFSYIRVHSKTNIMILRTTLIIICSLVLFSCSVDNEPILLPHDTANREISDTSLNKSANEVQTEIIAGQHILAGYINVSIIDDVVTVSYNTIGDWTIEETHLFVGDLASLPTNGGGNPKIGRFPYSDTHPPGTTNVVYPTIELLPNECVYIAAHAVVTNTVTGQTETAWGYGVQIGGRSWAMMFEYCNNGGPF